MPIESVKQKLIKQYKTDRVLNMTELVKHFELDNKTVRDRLRNAKIEPVATPGKTRYFLLSQVMPVLQKSDQMVELKKRKLAAEAEEREIKVSVQKKELIPAREVTTAFQKTFSALHKEMAIRQPKRLALKLKKAKTLKDVRAILQADTDKIFKNLRNNYEVYVTE